MYYASRHRRLFAFKALLAIGVALLTSSCLKKTVKSDTFLHTLGVNPVNDYMEVPFHSRELQLERVDGREGGCVSLDSAKKKVSFAPCSRSSSVLTIGDLQFLRSRGKYVSFVRKDSTKGNAFVLAKTSIDGAFNIAYQPDSQCLVESLEFRADQNCVELMCKGFCPNRVVQSTKEYNRIIRLIQEAGQGESTGCNGITIRDVPSFPSQHPYYEENVRHALVHFEENSTSLKRVIPISTIGLAKTVEKVNDLEVIEIARSYPELTYRSFYSAVDQLLRLSVRGEKLVELSWEWKEPYGQSQRSSCKFSYPE